MKSKYPVIAITMMAIIIAVTACSPSSAAIEAAIAQTETARPGPTNTRIPLSTQKPTDTPEPAHTLEPAHTPEPTHTPEPAQPPAAQISMLEAILTASELDASEGIFHDEIVELLPAEMLASCAIDCAGRNYQDLEESFGLRIELDQAESVEAADNTARDDLFDGTIMIPNDISALQDKGVWPDNTWMSVIHPAFYQASASYGTIVIRILFEIRPNGSRAGYPAEVAEEDACFFLRWAMAMQVAYLIEGQAD